MKKLKIKNKKLKIIELMSLALVVSFMVSPMGCQAFFFDEFFDGLGEWFFEESGDSQIINKINVSTNTGNTTINGEVIEGETKSSIHVENIVNGTEIDPIEIESDANEVKVESEIKVDEDENKAYVHRETQIDSETEVEDYEVDLEETKEIEGTEGAEEMEGVEENLEESSGSIQEWVSEFIEGLKSFFQNIFNIF